MAYRDMKFDRKTAKVARYFDRVAGGKMGVPVSMQVALCDACFNRCQMCDHPTRVQHIMVPEEWLTFLSKMSLLGLESVCYSGGDPMAYAPFNRIMQAHVDLEVEFGMTITGYVPPTIDMELLKKAKWVRCSLDAVTPEIYEKVRGKTPVSKVLASMDRMLVAGVNVALGITLHADNVADLPNVMAYAAEKGITDIETHHIFVETTTRAIRVPEKWERKIQPFTNCHAALYQLYIDAQGDVYPCCITAGDTQGAPKAYAVGNIWRENWEEVIWPSVVEFSQIDIAQLPPICRSCCIERLSQINHVCGQLAVSKSFF